MPSCRAVSEDSVERYFVQQVELHGGFAPKLKCPGTNGVHDRLVFWPEHGWARVHLVELKTIGGQLDPPQKIFHRKMDRMRVQHFTVWTHAQVDAYVQRYKLPHAP